MSRLTRNIGGQILSYEASSLPPEQASCHCQGISSHNSARPSDSVTRAAHCFHFFEIPLTNLLYDSVTKKPPALNGLFVQKATPGVKKNNKKKTAHNHDVDEVRTARKGWVKLFKKFFELRQNQAEHFYPKLERCVWSPAEPTTHYIIHRKTQSTTFLEKAALLGSDSKAIFLPVSPSCGPNVQTFFSFFYSFSGSFAGGTRALLKHWNIIFYQFSINLLNLMI